MKHKIKYLVLPVLTLMFVSVQPAQSDLLCAKVKQKRNGRFKIVQKTVTEDSCPKSFAELIDTEDLKGDQGDQGSQGPQGEQGESGSAEIACWARFTTSAPPTVRHFGGEIATSVEATRNGVGDYTLKCNGDFSVVDGFFEVGVVASLITGTTARGIVAEVASANRSESGHYTIDADIYNTTTGAATDVGEIMIMLLAKPSDD